MNEKIHYFNISFPTECLSWCYSAKQLQKRLDAILLNQKLLHIFVPASDYAESMLVYGCYENRILNFSCIGGGVTLVFENTVLDLGIHAEGMLEYQLFNPTELQYEEVICPQEDCDQYYVSVADSPIACSFENKQLEKLTVTGTSYYCFNQEGFDTVIAEEAEKAHDLPEKITLRLSNGITIKVIGDDLEYFRMEFSSLK